MSTHGSDARDQRNGATFDEWSLRVALAATIGLTASGELALAELVGVAAALAWLLPTAIDVYVVQAFRRRRDVLTALALMVVTNAVYHLAERGLFGVDSKGRPLWWLIVGVAAIAPFVMWRIHHIAAPAADHATDTRHGETKPHATVAPQPAAATPPQSAATVAPPATAPDAVKTTPKPAKTKASAAKKGHATRAEAKQAIRSLYDSLNRRPLEGDMTKELKRIGSKFTSRQYAGKLRTEIEEKEPYLVQRGSTNVRAFTRTGT